MISVFLRNITLILGKWAISYEFVFDLFKIYNNNPIVWLVINAQ